MIKKYAGSKREACLRAEFQAAEFWTWALAQPPSQSICSVDLSGWQGKERVKSQLAGRNQRGGKGIQAWKEGWLAGTG